MHQPRALLAQPRVLFVQVLHGLDLGDAAVHRVERLRQHVQDGGDGVGHMGPHTFDQNGIDLGKHHQGKRRHHQPDIGEALGEIANRLRDPRK